MEREWGWWALKFANCGAKGSERHPALDVIVTAGIIEKGKRYFSQEKKDRRDSSSLKENYPICAGIRR